MKVKEFLKKNFAKMSILLLVAVSVLAIAFSSSTTYAYHVNDDGNLVSENLIDIANPSRRDTNWDYYDIILPNPGSYTLSHDTTYYNKVWYAKNTTTGAVYTSNTNASQVFNASTTALTIQIYRDGKEGVNNTMAKFMLNYGRTALAYEPYGTFYSQGNYQGAIKNAANSVNAITLVNSNVVLYRTNGTTVDLGQNTRGLFSSYAYDTDIVKVSYSLEAPVPLNALNLDLFWSNGIGGNYISKILVENQYFLDISNLNDYNTKVFYNDYSNNTPVSFIEVYFTTSQGLYNFNHSLYVAPYKNFNALSQFYYQQGYKNGVLKGEESGYTDGYRDGTADGIITGSSQSAQEQYDLGYKAGQIQSQNNSYSARLYCTV